MARNKTYARPCPNGCYRGKVKINGGTVMIQCKTCKGRGHISVTMSEAQAKLLSPQRPERRDRRGQQKAS